LARVFIGLMSGTSVDAVDAVALQLPQLPAAPHRSVPGSAGVTLAWCSRPIPAGLRAELRALTRSGGDELERAARAALELTEIYARAVAGLLAQGPFGSPVIGIGAHGQTVRHRPGAGFTIQLLDGALLAERCGLPVVCDFRSGDIAAGGQGAPLVPAFHRELFGRSGQRRVVLNIGGISNLTFIRADGTLAAGFDTGPGNTLLDQWFQRHHGAPFDEGGRWGQAGKVLPALLQACLREPYFELPAPKSTGTETFHTDWLEQRLVESGSSSADPADVQATLLELTAATIVAALAANHGGDEVLVCGGGVHNRALLERLRAMCAPTPVVSTAQRGIDPQAIEAAAFAWLAAQRIDARPVDLGGVTGARGARVLGALYLPPPG